MLGNVEDLREFERYSVVIPATCRSRTGFRDQVVLHDISCGGCSLRSHGLTIHEGDLVVVRPEGIEGLGGEVRWVRGRDAGIRFLAPIYGPVVDHLRRTFATFVPAQLVRASSAYRMVA